MNKLECYEKKNLYKKIKLKEFFEKAQMFL